MTALLPVTAVQGHFPLPSGGRGEAAVGACQTVSEEGHLGGVPGSWSTPPGPSAIGA